MAAPQKEYGLITRKKPAGGAAAAALPVTAFSQASRLAAFASDSDDDDTAAAAKSNPAAKVNLSMGAVQQRQIRKAQESALADDPTIYQYDELYDDLQQKRDSAKTAQRAAAAAQEKRPKYIERLLVTADARKKEYERRIERQVQKERDAEGAEFADKESFVTASYRAKLEEMRAAEAAEQRDEYLESIGDVTKQRDLGGFYRHLYEQRMGDEVTVPKPDVGVAATTEDMKKVTVSKDRKYRKRKQPTADGADGMSDEDDDGEKPSAEPATNVDGSTKAPGQQHIQSNLDADSDFSIDSSSEEDNDGDSEVEAGRSKKQKAKPPKANDAKTGEQSKADVKPATVDSEADLFTKPLDPAPATKTTTTDNADKPTAAEVPTPSTPPPEPKPVKVKVNIWLKRCVGDALLDAIERYHERKRAREAGAN